MGGDILVVEYEADIRAFLQDWLTIMGYRVTMADNGRQALDILADWRPDLVMLDILMPVMSGLTFLKIRQADPILRTIPVLVMTASMNLRDVPATADGVVAKPFALDQLLHQVSTLLAPRVGEARESIHAGAD
jgi:CheY-like chemotaxis protein